MMQAFLGLLLFAALVAPLIANDRPLVVTYRNHLYFPVFQNVPGTIFSPQLLPTLADYRNLETRTAILAHGRIVWPPIAYRYDTTVWSVSAVPSPPTRQDWLGIDSHARDVLAQTIYGLRLACLFGLTVTFISASIGALAGAVQGYYGGITDIFLQRVMELWSGIPQFFLIIILARFFRTGFWPLVVFLSLFAWLALATRMRAECLRTRKLGYVLAAESLGASSWYILYRHILPNAKIALMTFLPFMFAETILVITGLGFLGFGQKPGNASLGELLLQAKDNPQAPWLGVTAFTTLAGTLILLIGMGSLARKPPSRPFL